VHVVRWYSRQAHLTDRLERVDQGLDTENAVRVAPATRTRISDRLSDEQCADIVSAYLSGATAVALASRFGISDYSVRGILIGAGVKRPSGRLTDRAIKQARSLRAAGATLAEIAERLSVAESTVNVTLVGSGSGSELRPGR
jgi:DNA-binding NarL/FixJ family response regulator